MMQNGNPCDMEEDENPMNTPNGTENERKPFIPPVDMTDISFIKLAEKMKKLSQETLDMIRKDLQPDAPDTKKKVEMDTKEESAPVGEAKVVKVEATDMSPKELLVWLKKVLWYWI